MYTILYTNRFKKDVKKCVKRELDISILREAIRILTLTGTLPPQYKPHRLKVTTSCLSLFS
jgi:mRNA interferase YafQ